MPWLTHLIFCKGKRKGRKPFCLCGGRRFSGDISFSPLSFFYRQPDDLIYRFAQQRGTKEGKIHGGKYKKRGEQRPATAQQIPGMFPLSSEFSLSTTFLPPTPELREKVVSGSLSLSLPFQALNGGKKAGQTEEEGRDSCDTCNGKKGKEKEKPIGKEECLLLPEETRRRDERAGESSRLLAFLLPPST